MCADRLRAKPESKYGQFLRSILVSNLSFLLDLCLCAFLVESFRLDYMVATLFSFTAGSGLNYLLSILWIFESERSKRKVEFSLFLAISFIGLGLNSLGMYLFTSVAGWFFLYSRIASAAIVFLFNYFCKKYLLFIHLGRAAKS
jgi:putative flippase GtrA